MCRSIKTLFNYQPPATADEIKAASLQFVRKISGFNKPSHANLDSLETSAEPKDREIEAARAKARAAERFGTP